MYHVLHTGIMNIGEIHINIHYMNIIPNGPPSSTLANYLLISIISALSMVFEHQGCTLRLSLTLQSVLESGQDARIDQIDFSAAFGRVNHQGILYSMGS